MELRNRATGAVITDAQFRAEHPNASFPKVLDARTLERYGYDPILEGPQAAVVPPYQVSIRDGIEEINGQWFTRYIAGPVFTDPDEEAAYRSRMDADQAERIRAERNRLLADCDWTQLSDAPVDAAPWAAYRQTLRDITAQADFPWDVTWPEVPA